MPSLSVIDLAMFVLETPARPMNIGPLVLLRPPKGGGRRFVDRLHKGMMAHQPGPPFNYRLNMSMTSLPTVEPMKNIDLSNYVHRVKLDGDGSMDELIAKVCALHEGQIPREGLLWQFYIIEGLADGRIALYGKVHHGIIDGRGFVQAVTHWFSADPADMEVRAMWQGLPSSSAARRKQESGGLSIETLLATAKKGYSALGAAVALSRMFAEQGLRHFGFGDQALDLPFAKVSNALSGETSAKRTYAFTMLPLGEVKALGKAVEATVNDILLVALDSALSRYLGAHKRKDARPLVVDMPLALPAADGGNQIAVLQFAMGKPNAKPAQRLAEIRKETARVKNAVKSNSTETVMLYTTVVHALPALMERFGMRRTPLVSNLMFSNPFGLTSRQYLMGAEVELALPMSVVAPGQMLNVTVVTLGDQLQVGFLGVAGVAERLDELAAHMRDAFDEMKAALAPLEKSTAAKANAARTAKTKTTATKTPTAEKATVTKPPRKPAARPAAAKVKPKTATA